MATATPKTKVNRSAQVFVADTTVDDITAAQAKVGAPTTARVTTGSGGYAVPGNEGEEVLPYSITFSWPEEV